MQSLKFSAVFLTVLVLAVGCGKKEEASAPVSLHEMAATQMDPAQFGVLHGTVTFEGEAPAPRELPVGGNPECSVMAHGKIMSEDLLVKEGKLANVFIYVKEGLENFTFPAPAEPVEVSNTGCVYVPHVVGVQVNQPLQILNNDATLHNVHALPKDQPGWNLGLPFQGMKQIKKFSAPEVMIPLKCDVHPWMMGYIGVLPHPYFAVTGENGEFSLKNLPPGNYVLEAWHETLGTQQQSVILGPREDREVLFSFRRGAVSAPAP